MTDDKILVAYTSGQMAEQQRMNRALIRSNIMQAGAWTAFAGSIIYLAYEIGRAVDFAYANHLGTLAIKFLAGGG